MEVLSDALREESFREAIRSQLIADGLKASQELETLRASLRTLGDKREIARLICEYVDSEWELMEFSAITVDEGRALKSAADALAAYLTIRLLTLATPGGPK